MNEDCLGASVSFHGIDLFNALHEKAVAEKNDILLNCLCKLKSERPSSLFHQSKNERSEFGNLNERVQKFVANNANKLFLKNEKIATSFDGGVDESLFSNSRGIVHHKAIGETPAFENFLSISINEMEDRFFSDIRVGDIVCTEVRNVENFSLTVRLLCTDGKSLQRDLTDLHIETYIGRDDLTKQSISLHDISKHTLIRAVVLSVDTNKRQIGLTLTNPSTIDNSTTLRLGIITETDLPSYFRIGESRDRESYNDCLRNSMGFRNPNASELLCEHLKVPMCQLVSYFDTLNNADWRPETYAIHLRKVQTHKMSMKSVAKGVEKLRQNDATVAMQHFNKALEIEPENAEAYVGRGALYANKNNFMLAIKDFEDALRYDENHANATKYLMETLLAQCKVYERKKKRKRLNLFCRRVLELDPDNIEAKRICSKFNLVDNEPAITSKLTASTDSDDSSDIVEIEASSASKSTKRSPSIKRQESCSSDNNKNDGDIRRQLHDLYKKYGVDQTNFVEDETLMDKLKRYHEKYAKAMNLNNRNSKRKPSNDEEILSSYSDNSSSSTTNSSSSSSSSSNSSNSSPRKRRISEEKKSQHVFERKKPVQRMRPDVSDEKRRSKYSSTSTDIRRNSSKLEYHKASNKPSLLTKEEFEKHKQNGNSASSSTSVKPAKVAQGTTGLKLKNDLKNMEDFINSLKSKQK